MGHADIYNLPATQETASMVGALRGEATAALQCTTACPRALPRCTTEFCAIDVENPPRACRRAVA